MTDESFPSTPQGGDLDGGAAPPAAFSAPVMAHLAELRRRILWILATLGLSTLVSYFFAEHIYGFLVHPLAVAMGEEEAGRDRRVPRLLDDRDHDVLERMDPDHAPFGHPLDARGRYIFLA